MNAKTEPIKELYRNLTLFEKKELREKAMPYLNIKSHQVFLNRINGKTKIKDIESQYLQKLISQIKKSKV